MIGASRAAAVAGGLALLLVSTASRASDLARQAAAPAWDLKSPAPVIALKPPKLEKLEGENCAECHAAVVEEWASTAHAVAWKDEVYQEEVKEKTRPQSCYGCHVPKPLLEAGLATRAEAREDKRDLGIACASCHLGEGGVQLGPTGANAPTSDARTGPHATKLSDHMTEKSGGALCVVCHATSIGPVVGIAKDYVASKQEERGRSCLACHMAPVERAPSKGAAEGAAPRKVRSHEIQTPRDPGFLRRAFEPSLKVEGGKSIVTIANQAGHRVPGLIGRSIELSAEVLDAQGAVRGRGSITLDARSYLPVDGTVEITVGAVGTEVHLVGLHNDPRAEKPVPFLEAHLKP
jgi:hypothetical protein